jgi:hypothetical protein
MSHALRIARHQQLVLCDHGLRRGDVGAERRLSFSRSDGGKNICLFNERVG